jgi:multiple sugar transport system substrate-binding protein
MKKFLNVFLVLALLATCVSGIAFAEEKPTLTVAFNDSNDLGENYGVYKWVTNTYNEWAKKDSVNLKIQAEVVTDGDFFTKMQLQLADGSTAPDVILYDTFQLQADVAAGYFLPLDKYLATYDAWNNGGYYEATKAGTTAANGSVYGVPSDTDTRGLWYNKAVFEKAGLGTDWQPQTWQDILDACKKIKETQPDVVPMWFSSSAAEAEGTTMNSFLMWLYGTGERLVDPTTGVWTGASQGIKDSLQFIQDVYKNGFGGSMSEVISSNAWATFINYFKTDKLGIYMSGNWIPSNFLKGAQYEWDGYQDKIGFAKMPLQKGNGYITLSGGWCLSIAALSKHPDEAWDFITQLMDPKQHYVDFIKARGDLATRTELNSMDAYTSTPFIKLATDYLSFTAYRPANENYSTVSSYIYKMVEEVVTGTDIDTAMKEFSTNLVNLVGADKVQNKVE